MDTTQSAAEATSATTLDNLQAAFNGESNAHANYLAFATKADAEGFAPVASLFRAAARAEEHHARNHAEVIRKLGATPVAIIAPPSVKSTRENLEAAIQGETYERDVMYPNFIAKARQDGENEAVNTFQLALAVEAQHAQLYAEALKNLESLRSDKPAVYYVCPYCGSTTDKAGFDLCPVCSTPEDEFEEIR
jgi:rubrerythrin